MVNLLEIPRMVVFFVNEMIEMLRLFQKRSCVLSSYNENQEVATMGTLSDQFNLSCKEQRFTGVFTVSVTYFIDIRQEA